MVKLNTIEIDFWDEKFTFYLKTPQNHSINMIGQTIKKLNDINEDSTSEDKLEALENAIESSTKFINNVLIAGRDRQKKACTILFGTDDTEMYFLDELMDIIQQIVAVTKELYDKENISPEAEILNT